MRSATRTNRRRRPAAKLFSKPGCPLCQRAEQVVVNAFGRDQVEIINIIGNQALEDLYIFRIPVLVVEGNVVAEGQISRADAVAARTQAGDARSSAQGEEE